MIRNQNRNEDGYYLFPYEGYLASAYIPSRSQGYHLPYEQCARERRFRQYPCLYEAVEEDNSYAGLAGSLYGDTSKDDLILEANQYYDSGKEEWYKVELKEGILIVIPRP
jgi:hypothetical protein